MREEEKTKRMTKALKFNKAFDVAKVQSEILSQQNQRTFDEHLKASKNFLSLLKQGLPEELMNYLDSPRVILKVVIMRLLLKRYPRVCQTIMKYLFLISRFYCTRYFQNYLI